MARQKPKRGGPLTPEQAYKGRRGLRIAFLCAFAQAWVVVAVAALTVPHLLVVFVALAAVYSITLPLTLRHLYRDIDRRVVRGDASGGTAT
jgi:hypothetical protein